MAPAVSSPAAAHRSPVALWHLFSLDAPSVAFTWTMFLARLNRVYLPWHAALGLAVAVWMIYVADRILDGSVEGADLEERHRFHARHRSTLLLLFALCVPLLATLLWAMPLELRIAWSLLGVPFAIYAAAVHVFRLPRLSKEFLVALLFALACIVPCLVTPATDLGIPLLEGVALGGLCLLNVKLISHWESVRTVRYFGSISSVTSTSSAGNHAMSVIAALPVLLMLDARSRPVGIAALLSFGMLFALDRSSKMPALERRSLADAALLSPLLLLPWLYWLRLS